MATFGSCGLFVYRHKNHQVTSMNLKHRENYNLNFNIISLTIVTEVLVHLFKVLKSSFLYLLNECSNRKILDKGSGV